MPDSGIILIQPNDSVLCEVMAQAIARVSDGPLWEVLQPPLPEAAGCGGALVVWDLWGFAGPAKDAWLEALAPVDIGVVLASATMDQGVEAALKQTGALGLITPNHSAKTAAVTLDLARANHQTICELLARRAELELRLKQRPLIERAKSVVMAAHGLSEAEAMRRMQKRARDTNQKLIQVAEGILASYRIFNGKPEG